METVYSIAGRPFRVDGDRVWARDGRYVGKLVDGMVFAPSGEYLGEWRNDRLGYRNSHSNKRRSRHTKKMDKMAASTMSRMAKMMPMGWSEFRG